MTCQEVEMREDRLRSLEDLAGHPRSCTSAQNGFRAEGLGV